MADLLAVYRANAAQAHHDAKAATLDNVRERNLRAAEAWERMAERILRTERSKAARAQNEAIDDISKDAASPL